MQNFSEACLLSCLHRIVVYELLDERTYFRLISWTTVISSRLMNIEWKLHASYGYRKCFPRVEMEYSQCRPDEYEGRKPHRNQRPVKNMYEKI